MGNSTLAKWAQTGRYSGTVEEPVVSYEFLRAEVEMKCYFVCPMVYLPLCAVYDRSLLTFDSECDLGHYVCVTGKNPKHVFKGKCPPYHHI